MAVLGHEPFGDVHVGHDFDTGDEGGVEVFGRGCFFEEEAIDAVAELEFVFEGEEVDIAGAFAECCGEDEVYEIDDRGFVGHDLDIVEVPAIGGGAFVRVEVLDHLLHRELVAFPDACGDFLGGDGKLGHLHAAQEADVIDDLVLAGLRGGDAEPSVLDGEGEDVMGFGEFCGE